MTLSRDGKQFAEWDWEKCQLIRSDAAKPDVRRRVILAAGKRSESTAGPYFFWYTESNHLQAIIGNSNEIATIEEDGRLTNRVKLQHFDTADMVDLNLSQNCALLESVIRIGSGCQIRVHETPNGRLRFSRDAGDAYPWCIFSADGSRLAFLQIIEHRGMSLSVLETVAGRRISQFMLPLYRCELFAISCDGRTIAVSDEESIFLYEVASGQMRCKIERGSLGNVTSLTFHPDGSTLAAASTSGFVEIWDLDKPHRPANAKPETLWRDLLSTDAAVGFRAIRGVQAQPEAALKLLREKLLPAAQPDAKIVAQNISLLSSPIYAERNRATRELADVADRIVPALREAAAGSDSEEARQRLEGLLGVAGSLSPEGRRVTRAVEAIESLALSGNAEAKKLLQHWAAGADGPALTSEAKAALSRVK